MSGRYLLDTNIIIALFADEAPVKDSLAKAGEIFIPNVAIGELCFGARKSGHVKKNLARIDEFAANSVVLGCDINTARQYGRVKNVLRLAGRPIPENDIWIAAITLQYDLTLITRDTHFSEVESLDVAFW